MPDTSSGCRSVSFLMLMNNQLPKCKLYPDSVSGSITTMTINNFSSTLSQKKGKSRSGVTLLMCWARLFKT